MSAGDTHPSLWAELLGMAVTFRDATDEYRHTLAFRKNKRIDPTRNDDTVVPVYDAGSDPMEIDFLFHNRNDRLGYGLYSPAAIRDQTGCARQYF